MDFESAVEFLKELKKNRDETIKELYEDMIKNAADYARIRLEWYFLPQEQKIIQDARRTGKHDMFLISLDMLTRYLEKQGINCDVIKRPDDRKIAGDFACYIAYQMELSER